jgi:drug/metabolite transporter (DMT)-like permease
VTAYARAQVQIHVCVLLWGFTAVLGRLITLPAVPLVFWRMLTVTVLLALAPKVRRDVLRMPWKLRATYAGIGAIVMLHWLSFYASIKAANASVAATCIALAPVFLSFLEPVVTKKRFDRREVLLGLAVVPGVALVVGGIPLSMRTGVVFGAVSAFLAALFAVLNKVTLAQGGALAMTGIELGAGTVLLAIVGPLLPHVGPAFPLPGPRDAAFLAILSVACTLIPFSLSLVALRELSAFASQLVVNLEPIYAIVLAALLLGERRELRARFYVGVAVVLAAVFIQPALALLRRPRGAPAPTEG